MATRGSFLFEGIVSGKRVRAFQDMDNAKFLFCDGGGSTSYVSRARVTPVKSASSKPLAKILEAPAEQPTLF